MVQKGNLAIFEGSNISEIKKATSTKIVLHVYDINSYLHKFFEHITIDYIFWWPRTIHGPKVIFQKGNWAKFEKEQNLQNQKSHAH